MINDDPVVDANDKTTIYFPEDEAWRTSITRILANTTIVPSRFFETSSGEIIILAVYPPGHGHIITYTIEADGYPDKQITVSY